MSKKQMSEYELDKFKSSTLKTVNARLSKKERFGTFEELNKYCSQFRQRNNGSNKLL
jgi:hypothetical protein